MTLASTTRRWWAVALVVVLIGVLGAAFALSALSEPSASPSPGGDPSPTSSATGSTPDARPSSGPTGTPSPGSLAVVPAGERRTEKPVPLTSVAEFESGLALRIVRVAAVRGVARGPGEIAGPAVRLELEIENGTTREVSLEGVVVEVTYGAGQTPAVTLTGPGGEPFGGTLAPGATATGRYVYGVPTADRDRVRVVASYTGSVPAVALTGAIR